MAVLTAREKLALSQSGSRRVTSLRSGVDPQAGPTRRIAGWSDAWKAKAT